MNGDSKLCEAVAAARAGVERFLRISDTVVKDVRFRPFLACGVKRCSRFICSRPNASFVQRGEKYPELSASVGQLIAGGRICLQRASARVSNIVYGACCAINFDLA